MVDAETKRLSRLVAIQTILQTKQLITATELASRFAVSVRTIYRDIKTLESAGIPILTEEGRGYALVEGYRLPPVSFTQTEANALITVEQLVQAQQDTSLAQAYSQAMIKLKAVLRSPTQEKANFLASRLKVYVNDQPESRYLATLQNALTSFHRVRIDYRAASEELTCRTLEPFALLMSTQENWLLVAWCGLRGAYRIFRLDRIEQLEVLDETFVPHPLTLKQYFESLSE
ncbi:helix-turn-helix transcriptional regulator [Spirosoma pollinicola]|uniref:DNA-binding transcriptional regulator n=1 Tax=Spirosoma pollinicola TaxID=2057025 RepID=A0A2K8Z2G8_9BACT|nr:YafY family protein [Spirosoma pollinicola]AUD04058.1 DNA-binding transcriptional regulator [Spirosoma pollinicola]